MRFMSLAVASALLWAPACGDDSSSPTEPELKTIAAAVAADDDFSTLETALGAAELTATLEGDGPFTVFAPTNAAFEALPAGALDALLADKEALTDVLTYHVVADDVRAAEVVTLTEATAVNGDAIAIEVVDGKVVLNGVATVTVTDIAAKNGVIHVIDAVLLPPEAPEEPKTIAAIVAADADFSTLGTALAAAELTATLEGDGPFTVFAPTNAAFEALPAGALDGLLADKEALADVLTYHVVSGSVTASDVATMTEATALNGDAISIEVVDGKVVLNGVATVSVTDIAAKNGVVHVIDAVLLPPADAPELGKIPEVLSADGRFGTLLAAVEAADLGGALAGDAKLTVFAPTDAAFAALPAGTVDALLADIPKLTDILTYHAVTGEVRAESVAGLKRATALNGVDISIAVIEGAVVLNGNVRVTTTDLVAANGVIHVIDAVLLPPQDIVAIAVGDDRFDTLEAALIAAGLADDLATPGPFTVFAPTDDAFAALPAGTLDALLADIPALTAILQAHVASGKVYSDAVVEASPIATLNAAVGLDVTVEGGKVFVEGAEVILTDIVARNGVIHVIDAVIVP